MKPPHQIRESMPIFDTMKWTPEVIDKHIAEIQQDAQPQLTALEKIGQLALGARRAQIKFASCDCIANFNYFEDIRDKTKIKLQIACDAYLNL
jgi:hypothetical protein